MIVRVIKILSLIALLISGIWSLSAPGWETSLALVTTLITALSVFVAPRAGKSPCLDDVETVASNIEATPAPESLTNDTYARTVGARLKMLREKTLGLSLREMVEFLVIDSISALECYESGEEEFPLNLIKKSRSFFALTRVYVETGEGWIFNRFSLSQDSVNSFYSGGIHAYSCVLSK